MLETLRQAFKIKDLRQKIFFTLLMLVVFRIGAHIPVPGIDTVALKEMISEGTYLGFFDFFSGGAFSDFTVFAMGIMPYITASIILQLLTVVVPALEKLAKEGTEGRKKIIQYTRYGTVILALIQAAGTSLYFNHYGILVDTSLVSYLTIIISLTAGTAFLMWLGELITEKGIGNGISLIIFAGIIARFPADVYRAYQSIRAGEASIMGAVIFIIIALAVIVAIVAVNEGQRRIPVQYSKRIVGRRVYGGQSTHIPLKVNQAGVIPVIFAMSLLMFPATIASWFPNSSFAQAMMSFFDTSSIPYMISYALLIIFFAYFYTAITFNPQDVADNIKKYGGFIPGRRPGKPTADYLESVLSRITLGGAVFLAIIALLPNLMMSATGLNIYFGGTSILIVVGVALDTMKQIESQMLMRHYEGFIS